MKEPVFVSPAEIAASKAAAKRVRDEVYDLGLTYHIESYGCQMNVHDSEKLLGMLSEMGFTTAETDETADLVLFNTCCVRDNAERRALGNVTWLKELKKEKPRLLIGVCGCMVQQEHMAEKIKKIHILLLHQEIFPEQLKQEYLQNQ